MQYPDNNIEVPLEVTNFLINLFNKRKFDEIIQKIETPIKKYPNSTTLLNIRGSTNLELKKFNMAVKDFKSACDKNPKIPELYYNLGLSYYHLGNIKYSILNYEKALRLDPFYSDAYCNLGMAQQIQGNFKDAISSFKKSIKCNPNFVGSYFNLGCSFTSIGKLDLAIIYYKKAISLEPRYYEAYLNLGNVFKSRGKFNTSIYYYKKAIDLNPKSYEGLCNLSNVSIELKNMSNAIKYAKLAIKLDKSKSEAIQNIGVTYFKLKKYSLAKKYFENAIQKKIFSNNLFTLLANCQINLFDFKTGEKNLRTSFEKLIEEKKITPNSLDHFSHIFFGLNYNPDYSAEQIYSYYKQFDQKFGVPLQKHWQPFPQIKKNKPKLKIGYVSPDFKKHSVENFLKPVLKNHNHKKFEIYAFAELSQEDSTTQEYKSYVDQWVPTQGFTDWEMAQKIRELEIDVLVDVAGHTKGNRLGVFAYKPTPISLSWLGFGYTTGLSAIDYFLTDSIVAPQGSEHLFSEKIWRINDYCYCCYEEKAEMGKVGPLPALEKGYITFGTLTRAIRINDRVIKVWAEILKRIKNSKLLINSCDFDHYKTKRMIISKFKEYEVDSDRLEIGYQSPPWDLMRQIDIALDCFPHNSGTTLIEHLYMGNPFITFSNRPGVGKIGSSILCTLGHSEWVATSEEEYIQKAVNLASDIEKLNIIRGSLRKKMEQSPIMDHKGFVKKLEKAYKQMWEEN